MVVSVTQDGSPTRWVVYSQIRNVLSEFWHYGHMNRAKAADLNGDGLPELVCWGFANKRAAEPRFKAVTEKCHWAVLILDPRRPGPGWWSMNPWMNNLSHPPLAYGYVNHAVEDPDEWSIKDVIFRPDNPLSIRVDLDCGLMLECDQNLRVKNIRPNEMNSPWEGPIPAPDDLWVQMWPPAEDSEKGNVPRQSEPHP